MATRNLEAIEMSCKEKRREMLEDFTLDFFLDLEVRIEDRSKLIK